MRKIFFWLSLLYVVSCIQVNQTKIATSRNAIRSKLCSIYSANYTSSEIQSGKSLAASYNYMSEEEVQTMIYNKNFTSPSTINILIVLPHLIAFAVLLFIWPCLCCCCVKPQKFPIFQKCRKPEKQMYTKCELKWPSYLLIVFCLIVIAGSVTALFGAADITDYYSDIGCKMSAVFDDTINGRISPTDSTKFFVGIQNLQDQLDAFNTQLSTFYSSSNTSLNTSSDVRTKQTTVEGLISAQYTSYTNTIYNNAFSSDGVTFTPITSNFKDSYYGPITDSSKILGKINSQLSTIFTEVNAALDPMITAWNNLQPKTQSGISAQITTASTNLATFVTEYNKYLTNDIDSNFDKESTLNAVNIIMNLIYGLILGLAIICLLGAILLTFCTVVRIRLLIYGTCSGLVFLGLLCFALFICIAYMMPNLGNICNYINNRIQNGITTQIMFDKAGFSTFGNTLTNCMSDGDGTIIGKLDNGFETTFDNIVTILTQTQKFTDLIPNFSTANIASPFNAAKTVVSNVKLAISLDVSDTVALTHINKVGGKLYSIDTDCNSTTVSQDAWYPNFINYSCPSGFKEYEPCSNLGDYTTTCPKGCYQIMDELYVSPSGDSSYSTSLQTRYLKGGGVSCNYVTYIISLNDNWNIPRSNKMIIVQNNLNNIETNANLYDTKVKSVQSNLGAFKTTLQANFDSRSNMETGSFYGVNCTVIGQSIIDFRNAACVGLLNNLNYNMICLGLICYGILFLSCCATCAGVRHFKHLQSMQVHVGYKGMPITVSENRVFNGKEDDNKQRSIVF